jgi:dienelactone hydrolase
LADAGFAVIAMEAVEHGDHPFIDPAEGSEPALRFLGIDLANLAIDAERIRGNFNQTNIDRLRLVNLIRSDGDWDGDGVAEFDGTRVGYVGASLGAMCGAGLLALSPDIDAAVLTIGGGRLMSIVTDTAQIEDFRPLIGNLVGSAELFDRLVPVAQHLVDAADPGVWAAHILRDRYDDRTPPSVLAVFGMADDVVPPASGRALARALGAPHLAPVVVPIDLVERIEEAPVSGNWAAGARTAATFQFDRVTRGDSVRPARHTDTAKSDESAAQIRAFFTPWAAGELPEVIDPFEVLGTPPLESP